MQTEASPVPATVDGSSAAHASNGNAAVQTKTVKIENVRCNMARSPR